MAVWVGVLYSWCLGRLVIVSVVLGVAMVWFLCVLCGRSVVVCVCFFVLFVVFVCLCVCVSLCLCVCLCDSCGWGLCVGV
mgnify:CR=1 FL=1